MNVNGRQIRLSGAFDDKGVAGGIGAVAVTTLLFPLPVGFFMTGTSAKLSSGTPVKGFVDEDVPLEIASAKVAPMTIGAPAAVTVSAPAPLQAAPAVMLIKAQ